MYAVEEYKQHLAKKKMEPGGTIEPNSAVRNVDDNMTWLEMWLSAQNTHHMIG